MQCLVFRSRARSEVLQAASGQLNERAKLNYSSVILIYTRFAVSVHRTLRNWLAASGGITAVAGRASQFATGSALQGGPRLVRPEEGECTAGI